jgi:hypothetical protein
MTKSGVKALDTMDNFMKSTTGVKALDAIGHANSGGHELTRFVIAGASKRGWTTWTLASVEPRVIAAGTVHTIQHTAYYTCIVTNAPSSPLLQFRS